MAGAACPLHRPRQTVSDTGQHVVGMVLVAIDQGLVSGDDEFGGGLRR